MSILVNKFGFSFLLTKKSKTILDYIKECFSKFGIPDDFWSDNIKDFSNEFLNEYLNTNNIKFFHYKTYNPKILELLKVFIKNYN